MIECGFYLYRCPHYKKWVVAEVYTGYLTKEQCIRFFDGRVYVLDEAPGKLGLRIMVPDYASSV